jgi:hypothetical protein
MEYLILVTHNDSCFHSAIGPFTSDHAATNFMDEFVSPREDRKLAMRVYALTSAITYQTQR